MSEASTSKCLKSNYQSDENKVVSKKTSDEEESLIHERPSSTPPSKPALKTFDVKKKELHSLMQRYLLTEYELKKNGYPRPSLLEGCCVLPRSMGFNTSPTKKCWRCKKNFVLYDNGEFEKMNDTCYHDQGTCATHIHRDNFDDCSGYLESLNLQENEMPGIYAVDCEMCYTVRGMELIRVSVVDFDCNLVYDSLVKPFGKILDYNTKWSGVTEEDMKHVTTTLDDVQENFLKRFFVDTIFVGHSLESDLKALRIVHSSIIDTSVLFPHKRGFIYKRALRNLVKDHLGLIIQENSGNTGHDSTEDAIACVKLMKWKLHKDTGYTS